MPYERNTFFFVSLPEPAMEAILKHTVQKSVEDCAKLHDGSCLLNLPMDADIPPQLQHLASYTHAEMKVEKAIREVGRDEF